MIKGGTLEDDLREAETSLARRVASEHTLHRTTNVPRTEVYYTSEIVEETGNWFKGRKWRKRKFEITGYVNLEGNVNRTQFSYSVEIDGHPYPGEGSLTVSNDIFRMAEDSYESQLQRKEEEDQRRKREWNRKIINILRRF